jgi:hypothetical protein
MATSREEIVVRAGFDNTALASGLRSSAQSVTQWATKIGGAIAGAFAAEKIFSFEKGLLDFTKNISLTAERLNVTTEAVQRLQYAGAMTGVSLDTIATALDRLARAKEKILHGDTGADKLQEAFERFGITIKDIEKLAPEALFDKISLSVSKTGANAEATSDAMELFGKSGGRLIPLLKEFREQSSKAPIISEEDLANLRKASDEVEGLWMRIKVLAATTQLQLFDTKTLETMSEAINHPFTSIRDIRARLDAESKEDYDKAHPPGKLSGATASLDLAGSSEGGEGAGMPGKAAGRTSKAGTEDLYRRRVELARKVLQISQHSQAETNKMFEDLRAINDELDIKNAPNDAARLKVQRDQSARDLRIEQNKLLPTETGRAFQKEKIYNLSDVVRGFDLQIGDLNKAALEKLSAHAEKQTLSLEKIAGAINGNQMNIGFASD